MLPDRLVPFREHDGVVVPRWLEPRDDVWLREVVQELSACEGLTVDEVDERVVDATFRLARQHGVERRVVEAVWHVERRRHETRVDAPVPPERVREVVFELAVHLPQDEALERAARDLGVPPEVLPRILFADRARARRVSLARTPPTESSLREQYNRTLAEALVVRTTEIVAFVHAHLHRVVSVARLRGLMLRAEEAHVGTKLVVSGPLAIFHETVKYGRALASWLHTVAATPAWTLEGRARLGGRELLVRLDASAPIPRVRELSRATDSKLEARLERDLRRHAPAVRFARESQVLRIGPSLSFPDFALTVGGEKVLVEVVGFWTPEYLAGKSKLATEADVPLVLCVDARHARGELAPRPGIVPFTRAIDVPALLEACEAAKAAGGRARLASGAGPVAAACEPAPTYLLRFSPTSVFARFAVAAGASRERWAEEIVADVAGGGRLRVTLLDVHPVYGPQLLLVGERFLLRAGRERSRRDMLFGNAVWRRLAGRALPSTRTFEARLVLPPAAHDAPAYDDVARLFERRDATSASWVAAVR